MKKVVMDQRSPEWHTWRSGGIGGSEIPVLVAYAKSLLADAKACGHPVAAREAEILAAFAPLGLTSVYEGTPRKIWAGKKGLAADEVANVHINRGVRYEDEVRKLAELKVGQKAEPLCGEHDSVPIFRVSFDGVLEDGRPLEIKCPSWRVFQKIKATGIPAYYYPQVQYQAFIAGAAETVFVAALIDEKGVIADYHMEAIPKDKPFVHAMLHVANFFWEAYVAGDREPPLVDKLDVAIRADEEWAAAATAYREAVEAAAFAKSIADEAEKAVKDAKAGLASLLGAYAKSTGSGVTVTRYLRRGTVNYRAALMSMVPGLTEVKLEGYRGESKGEVKVTLESPQSTDNIPAAGGNAEIARVVATSNAN